MSARPGRGRPVRRRVNPLVTRGIEAVDWKDTALLRTFVSDRGKIRARRVTGLSPRQQRQVATAIRNAREMALLPYRGRAGAGLMGRRCALTGRRPGFGNRVSHSHRRTGRRWDPNVQERRYWLPGEKRHVRLRVSAKGIKTVDRIGIEAAVARMRVRGERI